MITAVDTNVIADLLLDDRPHRDASHAALLRCRKDGPLIVGPVAIAELTALTGGLDPLGVLRQARITFVPIGLAGSTEAGQRWTAYRSSGGERGRIAPDFLVGAHAIESADRLLTRDRGFYRLAFKGLTIIEP